jgi:hypothetical protein
MEILGWVFVSALVAGPLCDRLLALQRHHEPALWESAGRPCADFWKPSTLTPDRLDTELAAMVAVIRWVLWTPSWIEQRGPALWLLWGLRVLLLSDAIVIALFL